MISIKMVDGTRYDTDNHSPDYDENHWLMIYSKNKVAHLNPAYIVSITEVGNDKLQEMAH